MGKAKRKLAAARKECFESNDNDLPPEIKDSEEYKREQEEYLIDTTSKELLWQGIGSGALGAKTGPKKEERIQRFVQEILNEFPPEVKKIN